MRSRLLGFLLLTLTACSSPSEERLQPASPERIDAVCDDWSVTLCGKRDECGSEDVDACVTSAKAQCVYDAMIEPESCQSSRLGALDRCAEVLADMTCDEWCGENGSCYLPCLYACPAS